MTFYVNNVSHVTEFLLYSTFNFIKKKVAGVRDFSDMIDITDMKMS